MALLPFPLRMLLAFLLSQPAGGSENTHDVSFSEPSTRMYH